MRYFSLIAILVSLSIFGSAAPVDTNAEAGPSSKGATAHPTTPNQAPTSLEPGQITSWSHTIATTGPPHFKPLRVPQKRQGSTELRYDRFLNTPHGLIVTKDHGTHVEGVTITHTVPKNAQGLDKQSGHYGVVSVDKKKPSYIVKHPVSYAAKKDAIALPHPAGIASKSISPENLAKLRADLCKPGAKPCSAQRSAASSSNAKAAKPFALHRKPSPPRKEPVGKRVRSSLGKQSLGKHTII